MMMKQELRFGLFALRIPFHGKPQGLPLTLLDVGRLHRATSPWVSG